MESINELLHTKHTLKFNENGKFRILVMSDVQEFYDFNPKTLSAMRLLLDKTKPDLVVLAGDNCYGPEINSTDDMKRFLDICSSPMEERKIPWAHVFGNHDHDASEKIGALPQQLMYEEYPMCVSKHQVQCHEKITENNVTNFVLPILSNDEKDVLFNVWGLDSGPVYQDLTPFSDEDTFVWAVTGFEQLQFYWESSIALEKYAGHKVPGLLVTHVAPHEYSTVMKEPETFHLKGCMCENIWHQTFNNGLFAMILQRRDIGAICVGHSHKNDFESEYCKVKLCFDGSIGYSCYGEDTSRGGRVFDIDASDPSDIKTTMVHMIDFPEWKID